ncbi:MAG: hypothetical protein A3F47_01650 [Candidatus Staskawiczbacteria bacterium RIFCSPHIGHO2_12_FULL_38_11]|uniref:Uncharacterized protein n=1 Tax=Candidatus Staskawiczbacteria bacterium RIFCSPHIGHO2_12_FULL_38_11 TaxID=1802209 RepID=A0A1G2I5P8_9BACT|nr:MAG: hypothetical protein A3F47_01650 [Candidatus Staskawiczbacteria bacterium RIFCSPHIGHO2_12_FULL_38_11]
MNTNSSVEVELSASEGHLLSRQLSDGRSLVLGKMVERTLAFQNILGSLRPLVDGFITSDEIFYFSRDLSHEEMRERLGRPDMIVKIGSTVNPINPSAHFVVTARDLDLAKKTAEFLTASLRGPIQEKIFIQIFVPKNSSAWIGQDWIGQEYFRIFPVYKEEGEGNLRRLKNDRLGSKYKNFNEP